MASANFTDFNQYHDCVVKHIINQVENDDEYTTLEDVYSDLHNIINNIVNQLDDNNIETLIKSFYDKGYTTFDILNRYEEVNYRPLSLRQHNITNDSQYNSFILKFVTEHMNYIEDDIEDDINSIINTKNNGDTRKVAIVDNIKGPISRDIHLHPGNSKDDDNVVIENSLSAFVVFRDPVFMPDFDEIKPYEDLDCDSDTEDA